MWYFDLGRKGCTFGRLLDLYEFANTYTAHNLNIAVMLQLQRLVDASDTPPGPDRG